MHNCACTYTYIHILLNAYIYLTYAHIFPDRAKYICQNYIDQVIVLCFYVVGPADARIKQQSVYTYTSNSPGDLVHRLVCELLFNEGNSAGLVQAVACLPLG